MEPDCGNYRTIHIPPPKFEKPTPNGTFCRMPSGCSPDTPMGGWLTPLVVQNIGAWVAGVPIEEAIALQLAYMGRIAAIAVTKVSANATGALLTPANVRLGQWSTTKKREVYPGLGEKSAGTGSVAIDLSTQDTTAVMRDITQFSQQALIDGLNALPPPMQALDASGDNALFRFTIDHMKTVAIDVEFALYIAYNAPAGS